MPTIAVTIVDQTVAVTQVGEIGLTGATGATGTVSAAGDGTAGAPGIAFASDTDTGFWRPGANTLAASTGGVERARIDSSGNVGLGDTLPASKLSIKNAATVGTDVDGLLGSIIYMDNGSATNGSVVIKTHSAGAGNAIGGIKFASSPDGANYSWAGIQGLASADGNNTASTLAFYTALTNNAGATSTERMRIDINGSVGIGTDSPGANLHVRAASGNSTLRLTRGGANDYGLNLTSVFNDGNVYIDSIGDAAGVLMKFRMRTLGTPVDAMTLASDGKVGIGTDAPQAKLSVVEHVTGSVGGALLLRNDGVTEGSGTTIYMGYAAGGVAPNLGQIRLRQVGFPNNLWGSDFHIDQKIADATYRTELAIQRTTGNVGIGTSSPGCPLTIAKAVTDANIIDLVGGPDTTGGYIAIGRHHAVGNDNIQSQVRFGNTTAGAGLGFLAFATGSSVAYERMRIAHDGNVTPGADNTQNLGSGSLRWATIYAGTGTINTSDERYKVLREGGDLTDAEFAAWSNVRAIVYQDKDAFERKGSAARLHIGYSWQSIQAAFEAEGLDAARYGLWCEDALEAPVEKTRMVSRPVEGQTETIPVLDDEGKPVFEQIQETEEVEQPFEEVRMIDGAPVLVKGVRTVAQPVFDSVQIRDEDGELLFYTPQPIEDPETGELVEGDPVPRTAPVPRMIRKAKTETVPVMEEVEETFTEMEPTGETRGALRYNQCSVIEAAWLRRELASVVARLSALEAA